MVGVKDAVVFDEKALATLMNNWFVNIVADLCGALLRKELFWVQNMLYVQPHLVLVDTSLLFAQH